MGTVLNQTINVEYPLEESYRLLIARIAGSELFQKSPRLREFLSYTADCTLRHRLADVREQVIAERVFGRTGDFQSAQDSIVRAEARNLRKRLELYFATEGLHEPTVVSMPKGGYSLVFMPRMEEEEPLESVAPSLDTETVTPLIEIPRPRPAKEPAIYRKLSIALGVLAACTSILAFYFHSRDASATGGPGSAPIVPFSGLLNKVDDTLIVTSDTGFLQISFAAHRRLTLDEYMARTYPNVPDFEPLDLIHQWNIYEFTDAREVAVGDLIIHNYPQFASNITMRSGHEVQLQDFKDHNAILVGSPISNPWAQLYEDKLSFHCELDGSGIVFQNKSARRGELAKYPSSEDASHNYTYARLAFLPRAAGTGAVLMIAGTTAQSTQAAGEFVIDRARLSHTLRDIGIDPNGTPRYFEILLRCNNFVSGAILPEVVAARSSAQAKHEG